MLEPKSIRIVDNPHREEIAVNLDDDCSVPYILDPSESVSTISDVEVIEPVQITPEITRY